MSPPWIPIDFVREWLEDASKMPMKTLATWIPRHSRYGIFTYISHLNYPNVGKYTIH